MWVVVVCQHSVESLLVRAGDLNVCKMGTENACYYCFSRVAFNIYIYVICSSDIALWLSGYHIAICVCLFCFVFLSFCLDFVFPGRALVGQCSVRSVAVQAFLDVGVAVEEFVPFFSAFAAHFIAFLFGTLSCVMFLVFIATLASCDGNVLFLLYLMRWNGHVEHPYACFLGLFLL